MIALIADIDISSLNFGKVAAVSLTAARADKLLFYYIYLEKTSA